MKRKPKKLINVGQCVCNAQLIRNMTQADFARGMGVSPQQITRWRTIANMRIHSIQDIASFFQMKVDEFLDLENFDIETVVQMTKKDE